MACECTTRAMFRAEVRASILCITRERREPITYTELATVVVGANRRTLGIVLNEIAFEEHKQKLPLTCTLVVSATTGRPSTRYYDLLCYLGRLDPKQWYTETLSEFDAWKPEAVLFDFMETYYRTKWTLRNDAEI